MPPRPTSSRELVPGGAAAAGPADAGGRGVLLAVPPDQGAGIGQVARQVASRRSVRGRSYQTNCPADNRVIIVSCQAVAMAGRAVCVMPGRPRGRSARRRPALRSSASCVASLYRSPSVG